MAATMIARQSSLAKALRPSHSRASVVARAARPLWYPGATAPAHLDGTLAGDFGFDPLQLGTDPERLKWFVEAELYNGRWAMAACAGILFTDLLGLPKWWLAGAETYAVDTQTQLIVLIALFSVLEAKRYDNFKKTGKGGFLTAATFDPLGLNSADYQLKEVKNGRLAMLAFVGFASGAAIYGKGPIELLSDHLADPTHANVYSTSVAKEFAVTSVAFSIWPIIIEATKSLNKGAESKPLFPWNEPWKA